MKGTINPDHIPKNKFSLRVRGMPEILFTEVSGIEEETEKVDIPDRTAASGGQSKAFEFTAKVPLHHTEQIAALNDWVQQGRDPVDPGYKKVGTFTRTSISGMITTTIILYGLWVFKDSESEAAMSNEGEMVEVEYSFSADRKDRRSS